MRGWVVLASFVMGCSTSSGDDAGVDCSAPWNALIPTTTQYHCDGSVDDAAGCVGDPSTGGGNDVHSVGCEAITTGASGSDVRCQQMKCGCMPLACYCEAQIGDASPKWICPN